MAVPASDEFAQAKPGLQWQWQANPQPNWLATSGALGQLSLAAVPAPAAAPNLWLVPNLLLQKLPAEHFTATAKLTFQPQKEGDRAGLVVLGMDYAALTLTRQLTGQLLLTQGICKQSR